jgi:hypothetical protein
VINNYFGPENNKNFYSQFGQDIFVLRDVFKDKKNGFFIVKDFKDQHCKDGVETHPVGEKYYQVHPKQRKLEDHIKESIKEMINAKAKPALIRETMSKKCSTKIQPKQIYNLKTQLEDLRFPTQVTDVEQINQFIDERKLIDGHNGFNCTYDIDTNE